MTFSMRNKTFLDLFPTPQFLTMSDSGLVVTDKATIFVDLKRDLFASELKPAHIGTLENPSGAVVSGEIKNKEALVSVLKQVSSTCGLTYTHATLPDEKAYIFTTSVGPVPTEGLKDAVAFIIEENVPVSLADAIFYFEILKKDPVTGKVKVAVSVVPKVVVNSYIEAFEFAGITPISFDIESQAIARALIQPADKRVHLIVNMDADSIGFYIAEDRVVEFSTTIQRTVADVKNEIRKVVTFWNERTDKSGQQENKIEKIILCGGEACEKDLLTSLTEGLDIRAELGNIWTNLSPARDYESKVSLNESLGYAAAVGSAISSHC